MLGSVDRFILTPIVLRFARKYIKDPEGAAVSDLQVSVSGGSVVFRNFELNLEEIVKDLPCTTVRAFARKLHIRIPWTKLATDPIEVVLDTVECVFAEGKPSSSHSKVPAKGKSDSTGAASPAPGAGREADGGWMGSLLERAVANISFRVNNIVCKYRGSGAVLTLSCQSAEVLSAGSNWEKAFLQVEDGFRKRCVVKNISISLDKLTLEGKVDAYQDPLLRTSSCDLRFALASIKKARKQRCALDVRLDTWDANVSDQQLHNLREIVLGFRSKPVQEGVEDASGITSKPEQEKGNEVNNVSDKPGRRSWFDYSSEDSEEEGDPGESGTEGRAAFPGVSMLGWAWNFLAEEDLSHDQVEDTEGEEAALREFGDAAGAQELNKNVEWLLLCKFEVGKINLRYGHSSLRSTEHSFSGLKPHSPTSPNYKVNNFTSDLIGTLVFERLEIMIFSDVDSLQAINFRLNTFILLQPPERHSCILYNRILVMRSPESDTENPYFENLDTDILARFLSGIEFSVNSFSPSLAPSNFFSEGSSRSQHRGALNFAFWKKVTEAEVLSNSHGQARYKNAIHLDVGIVELQYCPGLIEEWVEWLGRVLEVDKQGKAGVAPSKEQTEQNQPVEVEAFSNTVLSLSTLGDIKSPQPVELYFLQTYSPFSFAYFQLAIFRTSFALLSAESTEPSVAVVLETGALYASQQPLGVPGLQPQDTVGSLDLKSPALRLSATSVEVVAGSREAGNALLQNVFPTFSVHACVEEGGYISFCGLEGLKVNINIQSVEYNLGGADCHVVARVIAGLVPNYKFNLPPSSAFDGVWLAGQMSELTAEIGHNHASPSLQVHYLMLELFGSRLEVLNEKKAAGLIVNRVDSDQAVTEGDSLSLNDGLAIKTLDVAMLRLLFTNQTLLLVQALQNMNPLSRSTGDSGPQSLDMRGMGQKELTDRRGYQVAIAEMQIHLIALTGSYCAQVSEDTNPYLHWDGQTVLCFPFTNFKISVFWERDPEGEEQPLGSDGISYWSVRGTLTQLQMFLGVLKPRPTEKETGLALKRPFARIIGEPLVTVSGVQVLQEQMCPPTLPGMEHHAASPVTTERLVMEVGNLLVDITWHQHVSLYEFVTNFCSLPPVPSISRSDESTSLHRSDLEESVQKKLVMFKEMRTSISVNVSHATIKLDLWRDDASSSLEGKTDKISKLIFIVQGGTMVVDREIWKKSKPSLSDSTTNDAPGLQESNYDVVDRGKVQVAHLGVSTSRTETAISVCDHSSLREEVHSVHTFPVVQKGTTGSLSENEPIVTATWSSGPQGTTKGAIEVSPLDWFIDSRLIEEIITVCWEQRKYVKPVAGIDALPITVNIRIVARAGCLHAVPLFSKVPTMELTSSSDYLVAILDNTVGEDARLWLGVHDGQTPGWMDPNKLKLQNLDVSLVNWKVEVFEPGFPSPATLITPTDLRVVGRLLGCPGPISVSCMTQHLTINVCKVRLATAITALGNLLDGWSASWTIRQHYASPATFTDDLRCGVFQKSRGLSQRLARGEINFGDGSVQKCNATGGWISWRYPFPRRIIDVLISGKLFSEVQGLPEDTAVIFQLCFFDELAGVFVDAAPHLVAIEGELSYRIEQFTKVKAEEWRLSWFLPPGVLLGTSPKKARLFSTNTILKLIQVNPSTTDEPLLGDIPAVLPFMLVDLKIEEVRFCLVQGWEDTEVASVQGTEFHLGYHFWTSGLYTLAIKGDISAEYTDMGTYTHELLLEPARTSLQVSNCSGAGISTIDGKTGKDEQDLENLSLRPQDVRPPPTTLGYSLSIQTTSTVTLRLQKSILRESSRIADLLSSGVSPFGDRKACGEAEPLQTGSSKLGQFAFSVENSCPVDLAFRQAVHSRSCSPSSVLEVPLLTRVCWEDADSQEMIEIKADSSYPYAWRNPPKLSLSAERKLQFCSLVNADPYTSTGKASGIEERCWCDPIEVENGNPQQRQLLLDTSTTIAVVVRMQSEHSLHARVILCPSFRLTNMTATILLVRIRGLFPTQFLSGLLSSVSGASFEPTSQEEAHVFSEGELALSLPSSTLDMSGTDIMFATKLLRQSEKQATMSVLIEGTKGWSAWAPLEEPSASTKLLMKNDCIEWKKTGGMVPPSSPLLCLEHIRPDSDSKGQTVVVVWPIFYVKNNLFRSLSLQVGLQGSDVVLRELEHNMEAPINVVMSGRQYLVAKVGTTSESSAGLESKDDIRKCTSDVSKSDSAGEAMNRASLVLAHIKREEGGLKSKPILLTASTFRVGARFDISYQELPPVGSHDALSFSSMKTGHLGFSCILRTSVYKEGLPTILLSFVPMAVLHNHYFLPVAVRDAWLPPEADVAAWGCPGEKSAFSLQGIPGQQCGKKVCIGLKAGNSNQESSMVNDAEKEETEERSLAKEWVWSTPLEVENDSIQEVTLRGSSQAPHFLVRTQVTGYNVEDESDACLCCHVSVYPVTLVSNFTGHTLRFVNNRVSESSFWDCPDRSKLTPFALTWAGTEDSLKGVSQRVVQVGIVLPLEHQPEHTKSTSEAQISLTCNGGETQLEEFVKQGEGESLILVRGKGHKVPGVCRDDFIWSEGIDLCKTVHRCRLMLAFESDRGHVMMLTYSLGAVDRQCHLLIQRDPQPPCVIINDTDCTVEVRGGKTNSAVVRIISFSKLDYDPESLDRRNNEGPENLDDLFLSRMKEDSHPSLIRIRVVGHVWSEPFELTSQTTVKYVGTLSGSLTLSVKVEQLGSTFYVHIASQEEAEALHSKKLIDKVMNFSFTGHIEKLRVSIWDDDLRTLRGSELSGRSQAGEGGFILGCEEVTVVTLEEIWCSSTHFLKKISVLGVSAVSVHKLLVSFALLQVDMQLEKSELPVLITTACSPSLVGLANQVNTTTGNSISRVTLEFCKSTNESGVSTSSWIQELRVFLMPLTVNIDNATLTLARRLGRNTTHPSNSSSVIVRSREVGDAPDHSNEFFMLEPHFYVEDLQVDRVKFLITLRIARPVVLNTHQAPVVLASFRVRESNFPVVVLVRGLLAHYTTQVVLNTPGVLGSMDLLFNVTGLVQGIQAGVNDLLRLPVRGIQRGPHGFIFGLGVGGFSLVKHVSVWTLTSLAGFASTLSQVLDSTYSDSPVQAPGGRSFSKGFIGLGRGVARGVSGIILTPMRAAKKGRSSFFLGVGKGLVGAVAGPVSGALQLVAHTSQGLVGAGANPGFTTSQEAPLDPDSSTSQQSSRKLLKTRSSRLRFENQILRGTLERYMGHTEVLSLVYTSGTDNSPSALQRPVLLLSDQIIRALEDGGTLEMATIGLAGVEIDADSVARTLTIYGAKGGSVRLKRNGTMCDSKEGLQLYVQLEEAAWRVWIPLLRQAVPKSRLLPSK